MVAESIFVKCQLALDLGTKSYKEKQKIRSEIVDNGGQISYILTNKTNYLVLCSANQTDNYKCRKAKTLGIPIVSEKFVFDCIAKQCIVEPEDYLLAGETRAQSFAKGKISVDLFPTKKKQSTKQFNINAVERYKFDSDECPTFPDDYQVEKFSVLTKDKHENKNGTHGITSVEVHIGSDSFFRVMISSVDDTDGKTSMTCYVYPIEGARETLDCYEALVKNLMKKGLKRVSGMAGFEVVGSPQLHLLLEEMKCSSGILHKEVVRLVQTSWKDSVGEIGGILSVKIEDVRVSQIRNGIMCLMKIREAIDKKEVITDLSDEFYNYLPHNPDHRTPIINKTELAKKEELCQLIKDMMLVGEAASNQKSENSILAQYSSLKCAIVWVDPDSLEFKAVKDSLALGGKEIRRNFKIQNVFRISRNAEMAQFRSDLENKKLLLHGSAAHNFVGIFSRGLVLPMVVTNRLGDIRRDEGKLGNGIYFSDSSAGMLKYSTVSASRGTRLSVLCEVALGRIHETSVTMSDLIVSPDGYDSVKGIGNHSAEIEEKELYPFEDDELVVYNENQVKMKYLLEFTIDEEVASPLEYTDQTFLSALSINKPENAVSHDLFDFNLESSENQVVSGLIFKGPDKVHAKLMEVHVRAKIIDLVTEVIIFQSYKNNSGMAVEAKYVFPLSEDAAICGFEAFINDKHVVGEVKEKEKAHKEYKQAIAQGHGAYLMDEEKGNVFTVSVGNIPPHAKIVIKITYVSELSITGEPDSKIKFGLPGTIAPWLEKSTQIGSSVTQTSVQSVGVSSSDKSSLVITIDMPFNIIDITCPTHDVVTKKTATKACVKLAKSTSLGKKNFSLLIAMAEIHVPRLWIEQDSKDNADKTAMVTFFPEFDVSNVLDYEAFIFLDMSNSMRGKPAEQAKALALLLIKSLPESCYFNVVLFGSHFSEIFVVPEPASKKNKTLVEEFVVSSSPDLGGSDCLYLLNSILRLHCTGQTRMQNVFLISDGHLSDCGRLLEVSRKLLRTSQSKTRIFSYGIGASPHAHLLQNLSLNTGGAYEYFDPSVKNTWINQMSTQLKKAGQPVLTNIHIEWSRYNTEIKDSSGENKKSTVLQVPKDLTCIFNGSRLVAYSFMPNCSKATLHATVCGKEYSTIVTASDLCVTTGKTLHRLAAKAVFKEYESEIYGSDIYGHGLEKDKGKSAIIALSIKQAVVTQYTSFVAVEKRKVDEAKTLSLSYGPSISELISLSFTDILPELSWIEELDSVEDQINALLKRAKQMQSSSILQARNIIEEAKQLYGIAKSNCEINLLLSAASCRLQIGERKVVLWRDLKKVLLNAQGHLNYVFLGKAIQEDNNEIQEAIRDLAGRIWPEDCIIKINSLPSSLCIATIGCLAAMEYAHANFLEDTDLKREFWKQIHMITAQDNPSKKEILLQTQKFISNIVEYRRDEYYDDCCFHDQLCLGRSIDKSTIIKQGNESLGLISGGSPQPLPSCRSVMMASDMIKPEYEFHAGSFEPPPSLFLPGDGSSLRKLKKRGSRGMKFGAALPAKADIDFMERKKTLLFTSSAHYKHSSQTDSFFQEREASQHSSLGSAPPPPPVPPLQINYHGRISPPPSHAPHFENNFHSALEIPALSMQDNTMQRLSRDCVLESMPQLQCNRQSLGSTSLFGGAAAFKFGSLPKSKHISGFASAKKSLWKEENNTHLAQKVQGFSETLNACSDASSETSSSSISSHSESESVCDLELCCDAIFDDESDEFYDDVDEDPDIQNLEQNLISTDLQNFIQKAAILTAKDLAGELILKRENDEFWRFPSDESMDMHRIFRPFLFTELGRIIIDTGAASLGKRIFDLVHDMILTAIILKILEFLKDCYDVEEIIKMGNRWLKITDSNYPLLYYTLELGSSWDEAALSVIKCIKYPQ